MVVLAASGPKLLTLSCWILLQFGITSEVGGGLSPVVLPWTRTPDDPPRVTLRDSWTILVTWAQMVGDNWWSLM